MGMALGMALDDLFFRISNGKPVILGDLRALRRPEGAAEGGALLISPKGMPEGLAGWSVHPGGLRPPDDSNGKQSLLASPPPIERNPGGS